MTAPRRMGPESSKTRHLLLDTAERLMMEEGYAAVGIRRVAREAGVAPALVHYYFGTLDDLFLALLRRRADEELKRQTDALESPQPLRGLWELSQSSGTAITLEFIALGNHRKVIRAQLAQYAEQYRAAQVAALTRLVTREYGGDPDDVPPVAIVVLITAISRVLVMEDALGMTSGHAETRAIVEHFMRRFEEEPRVVLGE